jgi:GR25 family glycosyltransferase involved in LPS biosynthesis
MHIKFGNDLFSAGEYERAVAEYSKVPADNPLYAHAQLNIQRTQKLLTQRSLRATARPHHLPQAPIKVQLIKSELGPVKGIAAGPCLAATIPPLSKNHYYKLSVAAPTEVVAYVSVRDKRRSVPLYQSGPGDARTQLHLFLIPPSAATSELSVSLHPHNGKGSLDALGGSVLVTLQLVGGLNEVSFKPAGVAKPIVASMATIGDRLDIAIDAVYTLLSQVDRVHVHINDGRPVPEELRHEKVRVTTQRDHGNLGDSGKFVGARLESDAFVLVCDDDFLFPYDFALQCHSRLSRERSACVIGMHGIFLRYPLEDYYADDARNTMHYTTGYSFEATVPAAGTGAIFFDSNCFSAKDFVLDYRNMADIWFALECHRRQLPIIIPKRHTNWLIDNPPSERATAIWKHSANNIASDANTRAMQTFVLCAANEYISSRPLGDASSGKDYVLAVNFEALTASLAQFESLTRGKHSPAVLLIYNCDDIGSARKVCRTLFADILFVPNSTLGDEIYNLLRGVKFEFILDIPAALCSRAETLRAVVDEFRKASVFLLTELSLPFFTELACIGRFRYWPKRAIQSWPPKVDARQSTALAERLLRAAGVPGASQAEYVCKAAPHAHTGGSRHIAKFGDYFDEIYLLNLNRRADRLEGFAKRASRWGINFKRISAVDGSAPEHLSRHKEIQERLHQLYGPLEHSFKFESASYWEYASEGERISHLLRKDGKTFSPGGYGYLCTYKKIIEDAMQRGHKRIAVFDDDCLFHKDLDSLFSLMMSSIPVDWVTISLGTLQYDWRDKYISWWSGECYRCGGFSVGSHAQAYSESAYPMLLEYINRFTLPFDVGPLHYLKRFYSTKAFIAYPNLFIQDVTDTDIGDSAVQQKEGTKKLNVYKWDLGSYN